MTRSGDTTTPRPISSSVRGSDQSGLRAHNERLVLSLVRNNGPMAKAEIARATGLSAQTISVMMRRLEEDCLLVKGEPTRGRVGQPSIPMHLAAQGAFFYGLKIGRRSVDLVLIDFLGTVLGRVHRTHPYPTPDSILKFAAAAIEELKDNLTPDQQARIAGLGVAMPFRMWDWARAIGAPDNVMDSWETRDIRAELSSLVDFPVYLRNDASAACGAELVFGTGDRPRDFLHFFIGYYVGGGLVLNGSLHTGRTGNAAALGPLPIPGLGGTYLPLLDVASLCVLEKSMLAENQPTEALWSQPASWTVRRDILDSWIRDTCAGLAYAIVAACSILDLEAVLIDGWVPPDVRNRLVQETERALNGLDMSGLDMPEVRAGTIGPDARSLGAASVPLSERYMVDPNAIQKAM